MQATGGAFERIGIKYQIKEQNKTKKLDLVLLLDPLVRPPSSPHTHTHFPASTSPPLAAHTIRTVVIPLSFKQTVPLPPGDHLGLLLARARPPRLAAEVPSSGSRLYGRLLRHDALRPRQRAEAGESPGGRAGGWFNSGQPDKDVQGEIIFFFDIFFVFFFRPFFFRVHFFRFFFRSHPLFSRSIATLQPSNRDPPS